MFTQELFSSLSSLQEYNIGRFEWDETYLSSRQTALLDILNRRMFLDKGISMFTDPSKVVIQLKDKSKNRKDRNCSRKSTVDKMLFDRSMENKKKHVRVARSECKCVL